MATVVRKVPESAAAVKARPSIPVGPSPELRRQAELETALKVIATATAYMTEKLNLELSVSIQQSTDAMGVSVAFVVPLIK